MREVGFDGRSAANELGGTKDLGWPVFWQSCLTSFS
jgi:hypothetical protein